MDASLEQELLAGALDFDEKALAAIYDQFNGRIFAYGMRLLGKHDMAEECVAETFSRFLNAISEGRGPHSHLQAYLYRIAHNWITDYYRKQPVADLTEKQESGESSPHHTVDKRLQQAQIRAALHRLTPDQQQVIVLRFLEGLESEEVAAAINKPLGAVKALQHRAIGALRKILAENEASK
jgi:RNA polymerase sigma-70 factor, ECF subfamily